MVKISDKISFGNRESRFFMPRERVFSRREKLTASLLLAERDPFLLEVKMPRGEKTKLLWENPEYKEHMSEVHKLKTFPKTKVCNVCKQKKSIADFYKVEHKGRIYARYVCKICFKKVNLKHAFLWIERHPNYNKIRYKNRLKREPFFNSYNCAKCRCSKNGKYRKKGRKFLMTLKDFKELWYKDKAYLMKRPSIDRIDNNGDYVFENCRFIELVDNIKKGRRKVNV